MAEKLNYQPNPFASSLRRKKSVTIAVVIPEIANNFFALAIDGIQKVAEQKGFHVLTYLTHEDLRNEESTIKHLLSEGKLSISLAFQTGDCRQTCAELAATAPATTMGLSTASSL